MFGTTLNLTTTPSTRTSATIWRHVPAYLTPDADNSIHDFIAPPREMLQFTFEAAIPRPFLVTARQATRASTGTGAHNYFFYVYIGNLLYYFEFTPTRTRENIIISDPVYGRIFARIEAIQPGQAFPPNGVNDWTLLRHKDAPSGEGGGVMRLMEAPQPRVNGPREAQGGAPGISSAP